MNNLFTKIGDGIKTVAVDIAHGVEEGISCSAKVEKVLDVTLTVEPTIAAAIVALVKQAEPVIADVFADSARKGVNLAADAKTLQDAEAFFDYFIASFVPVVEKVYATVVAGVK